LPFRKLKLLLPGGSFKRGPVEQRVALDLGLFTCRLERRLLEGRLVRQMRVDLWIFTRRLERGLLEGRLVRQMRVDLFVLVLGRSLCLLVFHYSSFRRRIGSGVSNY